LKGCFDMKYAQLPLDPAPLARSLWSAADTVKFAPPTHGRQSFDVAVVGAGITGSSTALHLAEKGLRVVLLEARQPGWGASGRNGGQVLPGLKENPDTVEAHHGQELGQRMVTAAGNAPAELYRLVERLGLDCDLVRSAWLQPAHDPAAMDMLGTRVAQWQRRGADVELLDESGVRGALGFGGYVGGVLDRRAGAVHPLKFTTGLAGAASRAGVAVHGDSPVLSLVRQGSGYEIRTPQASLQARQVALCTDAYTHAVSEDLRRSIVPVISVLVATRPIDARRRRGVMEGGLVVSDLYRLLNYYRFDAEGRFVIGGRGAYQARSIERQQTRLRQRAEQLLGDLVGPLQWEYAWGGRVGLTADHYPYLHRLDEGLYAAGGYNGRGVALAVVLGRVLANVLGGASDQDLDFPISRVRPLPLHAFNPIAVTAAVMWNGWRDRRDQARAQSRP
jgi:glycine/D-amino acid oxidase-like deaminating enzyme